MGKEDETKRFIEKDNSIKDEKIIFLKIVSNIIKSGMNIIGVDTPEKM
jgi:Arginyl-tRNA synthetase